MPGGFVNRPGLFSDGWVHVFGRALVALLVYHTPPPPKNLEGMAAEETGMLVDGGCGGVGVMGECKINPTWVRAHTQARRLPHPPPTTTPPPPLTVLDLVAGWLPGALVAGRTHVPSSQGTEGT